MGSIESYAAAIIQRHGLTNLHLFTERGKWRVFGFRKDPKGYQASVENGAGQTIRDAISNLDARLIEGPIHKDAP
jgi:hypothetical protein